MNRALFAGVLAAVACLLAGWPEARSMPILMDQYAEHPQSLPQHRSQCVICHVHDDGSGPLTAFGKKYDRANLKLTPELVAEYGNLFRSSEGSPQPLSAHAEAAAPAVIVPGNSVPGNQPFDARRYFREECRECHGRYGDGDPFQGVPAWATQQWLEERSHRTEELLDIILNGKDKMIGHAGKITEDEARQLLEGVLTIARKYAS